MLSIFLSPKVHCASLYAPCGTSTAIAGYPLELVTRKL
jgi:hypothetical protein